MGCGGPLAVTVARARVGAVGVEVRHSAACSASWARITGAAPGDTVSVEVAGATERATVPEDTDPAATGTDAYTRCSPSPRGRPRAPAAPSRTAPGPVRRARRGARADGWQ
ncbi:DUF2690 domain-containing protein [Streptomyces sp. NPDC056529]|uniref:DUF2690 domain-containing protein n=1 Tax=Streptomyces sp. NPDC056529 TaxID=3345855 RepID=UPI0036B32A83